jgi:tetratricopeptide (TPR) repeat protein
MFSGRVLSLPGLPGAAQGASTGPLMAIPSPSTEPGGRRFNWGVVLRHELTHAFNLNQTGYLVPIWLTEGLAVRAEHTRRFDNTTVQLRDRLNEGTAFDLETIGRGYHNFGHPPDVLLAYYQGYLYVEFISKTFGEEAIARLLNAFRQGLDVGDAIRRACGVDKSDFEKDYREFLRDVVKGLPRGEKPMTLAELEAAHKKVPENPDVAGRLAGEYLRRGKQAEAKKLAEAALAKEKGHPGASLVLARILQREKDPTGARGLLETAAKENPDDPRALLALGRSYLETKEPEKAIETFESLRKLGPVENEVLETLVQLYSLSNRTKPLIPILEEVAARQPDNLDAWLNLAKLQTEAGQFDKAELSAREALFIDVENEEARKLLIGALRATKKEKDAEELEGRFKKK